MPQMNANWCIEDRESATQPGGRISKEGIRAYTAGLPLKPKPTLEIFYSLISFHVLYRGIFGANA